MIRLEQDTKQKIDLIKAETEKKTGERPSCDDVVRALLSEIDEETAVRKTFEKRKNSRQKNISKFDELFTL